MLGSLLLCHKENASNLWKFRQRTPTVSRVVAELQRASVPFLIPIDSPVRELPESKLLFSVDPSWLSRGYIRSFLDQSLQGRSSQVMKCLHEDERQHSRCDGHYNQNPSSQPSENFFNHS
jgi:hypothetical protein